MTSGGDRTREVYEAIGRFFCSFSCLEHELGEAIKDIFNVQSHPRADAIIGALGFGKKVDLLSSAVEYAQAPGGTPVDAVWKAASKKTMTEIAAINGEDRNFLAHGYLKPTPEGTLELLMLQTKRLDLKSRRETWTMTDFENKLRDLDVLTEQVKLIRSKLNTLVISVSADSTLENLELSATGEVIPAAGTASKEG